MNMERALSSDRRPARPRTAPRSASCSSKRTSSPSGPEHPPELDISSVSAISSLSRHDVTRRTVGQDSRQAKLERYKTDREEKELKYDILEARAMMLNAALTWAPSEDVIERQEKANEMRKKIAQNVDEIEKMLEFCSRVTVLMEAQHAADQTQMHLDSVEIPSLDTIKTLEELANLMEGAQLVEGGVLLPQGDDLERLKPRLEQLFSHEEQKRVEIAKKTAENKAQLAENSRKIEDASEKLIQIEKEKEMWRRHAESLQMSIDINRMWLEENPSKCL